MDRLVHWCITLTLISCSSVILLLCFRSPWHATPQATALATTAKQPFSWHPSPWPKQMNILWHCWVCMIVSGDGGQQQLPILSQGSLWRWSHQRRMPWVCTTQKKACNACLLPMVIGLALEATQLQLHFTIANCKYAHFFPKFGKNNFW